VVVLALALGLGLGLGLKKSSSLSYVTTNSSFLLDPSFVVTSTPTTRYYEFVISEAVGSPDGVQRTMLVVNSTPRYSIHNDDPTDIGILDQFPGPLIEVNSGDELVVNVYNQLPNGTTIHWHGQLQNGTNYMDGTNGITQCPIPPGMNFSKFLSCDHVP
jgi:FtsP/CotA-like multicopper oxidase with cupredoxin domain